MNPLVCLEQTAPLRKRGAKANVPDPQKINQILQIAPKTHPEGEGQKYLPAPVLQDAGIAGALREGKCSF